MGRTVEEGQGSMTTKPLRGQAARVHELGQQLQALMSQPVTGSLWHYCHWHEGCGLRVPQDVLFCKKHWGAIPARCKVQAINTYVTVLRPFGNDMDAADGALNIGGLFPEYVRPVAGCPACAEYDRLTGG
jgi:hypothetical protein